MDGNLWVPRRDLYFDIHSVLGSENELLETGYLIDVPSSSIVERRLNLDMSRDKFVKRVDQIVKNFQGPMIESILVNFYLKREQSNSIDQWIKVAFAMGVERIDLLFLGKPYAHDTTQRKRYKFDFDLFYVTNAATLKNLYLQNCVVCHPTNDFIPSKNLRSLSLESSKVDAMSVESLLTNCELLEELCLSFCEVKSSMLKIVSSSLCHLKVVGCYVVSHKFFDNADFKVQDDVNLILVDCLNLTSLEYDGRGLDTLNINTPVLKSIKFSISLKGDLNAFVGLCATFPELEAMHVTTFSMVTTSLKIIQPLKHLKELKLDIILNSDIINDVEYDPLWILNIIQAAPLLQKLSVMFLHLELFKNQKDIRDVEIFSHEELKVIELRGCIGDWLEIEFVMNVLKCAHKLEQIVLSPYLRDVSLDWESHHVWYQSGRDRISEKLQGVEGQEKVVLI